MTDDIKYLKNGEFTYNTLTGLLGKGAFGSVFKGQITKTGETVAIKALSLKLLKEYGDQIKEIMANEVAVMKDLSNMMIKNPCPFVVKIYDCFLTENNIYLVLQFCDSGDLTGDIDTKGKIPQIEAKVIIYQLVRALDFISDLNVIHRDLKPDNVFKKKTKAGVIYKLGDFGLAVSKTKDNQTAGTAPYMAPEMINGQSYGKQVDIFSLGCVAHQILFGQIFFLANTQQQVRKLVLKKPYKIPFPKLISLQMADFLDKCMKKNKNQRIKHKQLRYHPVFRDLQKSYNATYGQIDKSLIKNLSQSNNQYKPNYSITFQQSSQVVVKDIRWYINNEIHKAIFLQQIGRRLLHIQRQNTISIYLMKDALYRLNRIRQSFKNNANFTKFSQQDWYYLTISKQFKGFYDYLNNALSHALTTYESEYQVFMHLLSKYPQQKDKALKKLGSNINNNVDQQSVFADLFSWTQMLAQKQDQSSKVLAQQCILAMKIDEVNFDFSNHIKERDQLSSQVLLNKIRTLG